MEKLITVFTPTYNRAELLTRCYNSLRNQTSFNFEWIIVDDGSADNTRSVVDNWQKTEERFYIRYIFKENGGLHTAYNVGIENTKTELFVCIDSDDWMPENAIEKIEHIWESIQDKDYVGIMGVDCYENGACVGDKFPDDISEMFLYEKLNKKIKGDKKIIHRTELLKKVAPMPSFPGEKYFNPSYMMYQIDQFGKLYVTNDCFCVVNYQPDGMSSNIYKQYRNSPRSFAETRKLYLSFPDLKMGFTLRQYIHYSSSIILSNRVREGIKEAPNPFLCALILPFGLLLSAFVLIKADQ